MGNMAPDNYFQSVQERTRQEGAYKKLIFVRFYFKTNLFLTECARD